MLKDFRVQSLDIFLYTYSLRDLIMSSIFKFHLYAGNSPMHIYVSSEAQMCPVALSITPPEF